MTTARIHTDRNLAGMFTPDAPLAGVWKRMMLDVPMMLMAESCRLASIRLQAQADLLSSLARCKSYDETLQVQSNFAQAAMDDFSASSAKLMEQAQEAITREAA